MGKLEILRAASKAIKAWHGSPHHFTPEPGAPFGRFRDEAIGTGEGAQAFGRGHYLAEARANAEGYRDRLALRDQAHQTMVSGGVRFKMQPGVVYTPEKIDEAVALAKQGIGLPTQGHLYEADIHADEGELLDWLKPLSQQDTPAGRKVTEMLQPDFERGREARARVAEKGGYGNPSSRFFKRLPEADIEKLKRPPDPTGENAYMLLRKRENPVEPTEASDISAARTLKEAGVPGIQFLDQRSRGAAQGTRNFAIFDPKVIEIIGKYGIAGALGMGLISPDQAKAAKAQGYGAAPKEGRLKHIMSREQQLELGRQTPGLAGTAARENVEGALGLGGLGVDTGYGFKLPLGSNFMPTHEDISAATNWLQSFLPQGGQDFLKTYTQAEPQSQEAQGLKTGLDWIADPTNLMFMGAGKLGKLGKLF